MKMGREMEMEIEIEIEMEMETLPWPIWSARTRTFLIPDFFTKKVSTICTQMTSISKAFELGIENTRKREKSSKNNKCKNQKQQQDCRSTSKSKELYVPHTLGEK